MSNSWKRTIVLFFTSQTISLLGTMLVQYAVTWYITLQTKSGIMMMLSLICGFIPMFLLSPFAGVWADRYDRKKMIIIADGMIGFVTLVMAVIFSAGFRSVWLLLVAQAVRAVGSAVQAPAVGAILPQIVPADKLMRVNGINQSIQSSIMIVSPMVSGALLTIAPIEFIFMIDVVTAALAIGVMLVFLHVPPHEKALTKSDIGYFEDMKLGFTYILKHKYLVRFFTFIGFLFVLVTPAAVMTPLQVVRSFGDDVWRLSVIEVVFSAGMIAGGGLLASWGGFKNRMRTMVASTFIMAFCNFGLGLIPVFWVYLVFIGIYGIAIPMFNTPSAVILQEHVEESYMGRVFSVLTMLSTSLMPLSMLFFGPLGDAIRIEYILIGTGVCMLVFALFALGNARLMETGISLKTDQTTQNNDSRREENTDLRK